MNDYSELKKLAEKATPGPWWVDSHGMTMMSMPDLKVVFTHPSDSPAVRNEETGNLSHWRNDWDASYIATANPETILALIAENEAMADFAAHMVALRETHGFDSWSAALVEIDHLRAENAGLRTGYEAYERVNADLKAEVEVLLKALRVATVQMWNSDANMDVEAQAIEAVLARSKGEQP